MSEKLEQQLRLQKSRSERLKKARAEAEKLLEIKSRELFQVNQDLEHAGKKLANDVAQATYELSVTNKRLERALVERSTFIGQMSHEVRTPLNAIIGLSEILLGTKLDEAQADYIETINGGAKSLIVLLNDMLDITKIEAGRVEINPEPVNTFRIHKNIVSMFALEAEQLGLNLKLRIDSKVPKTIKIDKGRYKQIINNLISNALKNTKKGAILVDVTYQENTVTVGMGTLEVKVVDTGVGIPADQLDRIFNAYEQIGRPDQGVGLGLSICQQLSELMMGKIRCESKVGRGSIFKLSLPAQEVLVDHEEFDREVTTELVSLPKLKILVAEDNPTNQKVISAQLAQLGQVADITNNGAEAIAKLEASEYDVVILDILMPIMDGEKTIKTIRSSKQSIAQHYCIALTASSYQDQRERLLKLGFDEFLSKPLGLSELSDALKEVPRNLWIDPADEFGNVFEENTSVIDAMEQRAFDFSYLETQFGDSAKSIFREIAPSFLDHAYNELEQLKQYAFDSNFEQVKRTSHSMKGAASSIGLSDLANVLLNIENHSDQSSVLVQVDEVEEMMQHLKPLIEFELETQA